MSRARWIGVAMIVALSACEREAKRVAEAEADPALERPKHFVLGGLEHEVGVGRSQAIELRISPGPGHKLNVDYPWRAAIVKVPEGVVLAQRSIPKSSIELAPGAARVPIELEARTPGDYAIEGTVDVSVCEQGDASRCLWYRGEPFSLALRAKPAPGAAQP